MRYFGNAILLSLMALLILPANTQAQGKYTLSGQVFDSITAMPIAKPHVVVAGSKYNDIGDKKGNYKIVKLIPGTNNLIVWADGYDSSIVRFEIRKDMKLNVKLMPKLDTASLHIEAATDTVQATDTAVVDIPTPPKKKLVKKEKKPKKPVLTQKDKDEIKVLIEDVIFSKTIYFERFKNKRKKLCVWGSFSIDTGYLYTFKAEFTKKNGYELSWLEFKMKGLHAK